MKKKVNRSVHLIGVLAALVLVGLVAWWIRCEGQRARQMLQDVPRHSKTGSEGLAPAEEQATAAKAVDARPAAVAPRRESAEDFDLKDHDIFPGLPPASAPKTQVPRTGDK